MLINKHIEIVSSTEAGLSSMSKGSREAVFSVLSRHYKKVGITIVNSLADLDVLAAKSPDLVFLGMKFIPMNSGLGWQDPDKIWLADYLDEHGIPYTGSNRQAHELELNKHLAKQRVLDNGLSTSPFYLALQNQPGATNISGLKYPLFVKPANRGGGLGIDSDSVVYNSDSLKAKIASITADHQSDSLVEEYLPGREFSVAIMQDLYSAEFSLMPLELIAPMDKRGARLLSAAVKSADTESFIEIADEILKSKVTTLAIQVFDALGARDYGRIDIRLNAANQPQFLEANLIPSLLDGYGNFPKACMLNAGVDYESMLINIVGLALKRVSSDIALDDGLISFSSVPVALGI
jgi:D-alanine-D-alanine ligase